MAIEEINAAGGVLGKQIEPVVEDGASDWPTFAEKAEKLITVDKVDGGFGGWTSASRKAMLPVFEGNKGLLFYPVQYEGLEPSPNIFYTGATTNQQIVPGARLPEGAGQEEGLPGRQRLRVPPHGQQDHQGLRRGERHGDRRRGVHPARRHRVRRRSSSSHDAEPDVVFNTLNGDSNVAFFKQLQGQGQHARHVQTVSVSVAEEEVSGIGVDNIEGHLVAWNYYQTTDTAAERGVRRGVQGEVRRRPGHVRPDGGRVQRGLPLGGGGREGRHRRGRRRSRRRPRASCSRRPRARSPSTARTSTSTRPPGSGSSADGLINEVWNSGSPIKPDPYLKGYDWAKGLSAGVSRADPSTQNVRPRRWGARLAVPERSRS